VCGHTSWPKVNEQWDVFVPRIATLEEEILISIPQYFKLNYRFSYIVFKIVCKGERTDCKLLIY